MDTLVYTASTFLIPINIAAYTKKYVLMNIVLFLTLTSWAHHSIAHSHMESTGSSSSLLSSLSISLTYGDLDKIACYWAILYSFIYALFFTSMIQFALYSICLGLVFYSYSYVHKNQHYYKRGLENWRHHKYHILMHLAACAGFTVIAI